MLSLCSRALRLVQGPRPGPRCSGLPCPVDVQLVLSVTHVLPLVSVSFDEQEAFLCL